MARLGDIATVITKGTTPTSIGFAFENDGINFVKIESVDENGNFICEKFDHISDECHEKLKRSQLQENDILFSIAGAIGRTAIVTKDILPANTNQALAIIRIPQGAINYSFLLYILQSSVVLEQAEKKKQGVAQLNLSLKDIGDFIIPDIPLEEQQCIVDSLDKVSNLISLRKRQLSKLDELVKSRFIEMFGYPISNSFGLNTKPMTDICEIIDGDRGKNYPTTDDFSDDGYCLFLNAKNVTSDGFNFDNCMYITEEKDAALRKGRLKRGDVVLTTRGTIGNLAFYTNEIPFEHVRINSGMVILRMKQEVADEVYFIEHFKMQLEDIKAKIASGSSQPQLPISTMNKIQILIPEIEQQREFAAFVEQGDKSKFEIQKSLEKLETLKKALMQKYFG